LFNDVKTMILTQVKMKFVNSAIEQMPTFSRENISIDRLAAAHYGELGKIDHTAEFSIFGQIYKQLKAKQES